MEERLLLFVQDGGNERSFREPYGANDKGWGTLRMQSLMHCHEIDQASAARQRPFPNIIFVSATLLTSIGIGGNRYASAGWGDSK